MFTEGCLDSELLAIVHSQSLRTFPRLRPERYVPVLQFRLTESVFLFLGWRKMEQLDAKRPRITRHAGAQIKIFPSWHCSFATKHLFQFFYHQTSSAKMRQASANPEFRIAATMGPTESLKGPAHQTIRSSLAGLESEECWLGPEREHPAAIGPRVGVPTVCGTLHNQSPF